MSTDAEYPEDDAALAAEYVLGLLDAEETRAFERRVMTERALQDLVEAWQVHFADLADDLPETVPPAAVWTGIQARLFTQSEPLWRRLFLGRAVIGAALAGLVALAVVQMGWLEPERPAPFVAELASETEGQVARIEVDPETGRVAAELIALFPDPGRTRELWLIQGENAPVSLGLLAPGQVVALSVPEDLRPGLSGALLAISDEPEGGSPTGQPTGAVLAAGPITAS
ncbi:anti-sigma factor [Primorskyibacter aestuariivivens]|uniref:anti-sigma factor n=1 Tax=Primorskyibacter aestuariivivens TaxID=1888912 RepID=UPI002301D2D8|nr:anti-sigma factor [Primorskyibacter aestuariivivens]MDA7428664.1 anti-sigma factor [Primorskyibacter aestuariivivens]